MENAKKHRFTAVRAVASTVLFASAVTFLAVTCAVLPKLIGKSRVSNDELVQS